MRFKCLLLLEFPIVACGTLPDSPSTAPSINRFGCCVFARAVIACICLAATYIWSGNYSRKENTCSENVRDEMMEIMATMSI